AQRPLTSFVDGMHKLSQLRETRAQRGAWQRLEPNLSRDPTDGIVGVPEAEKRPADMPRGPIEEYADRAWIVSLAGFAVSFGTTRGVQRAMAALYGSLPRPARLGRDAFTAELSRILATRDSFVLDPAALRRLDRIDCLVLQGDIASAKAFSLGDVHLREG